MFHVGCVGEDGRFLIEKIQEYGVDIKYVQVHSKEVSKKNYLLYLQPILKLLTLGNRKSNYSSKF